MIRIITTILLSAVFSIAACSVESSATPPKDIDGVAFSLVVFSGASSETIATGKIPRNEYNSWFTKDFGVGGERIETPESAASFGALILLDGEQITTMPLSTWQIASGQTYFACQSVAIGKAPMFSVCLQSETKAEFLKQVKNKVTELPAGGG